MSKQDTTVTMTTEVEAPETTKFQHTWVLWYFDPRNKDWTLSNYKRVADLSTPQQLWTVVSAIPKEAMECGYFFFMRKGFRPIWEVPENENGGSWSKKVATKDIHAIMIDLMVHCVANSDGLFLNRPDTLVGFSTSPKGENNVVKIWNTSTSFTNAKTMLNKTVASFPITDDVVYTAHKSRR
jgi:translation initiation factor 4E